MREWKHAILAIAALVLSAAISHRAFAAEATTSPSSPKLAVVVTVEGRIDEYAKAEMERRFDKARALGADTVVLRIDTYGGLVTSALDMSRFIKRQHDLHVIGFVHDKAISAGAMIALACVELVMAPDAVIGDAAPISVTPGGSVVGLGPAERAKIESPLLADFYDSAVKNHHDPLLAEAMVAVGRVVYWVQNGAGDRRFVDEDAYQALAKDEWKPVEGVRSPIDRADTLLTLDTDTATKIGLASQGAGSADALASARGYQVLADLSPGTGEKFVEFLGGNWVRAVLLVVFLLSLYIGLHAPGHGVAEAFALASLGLLVGVPLMTGYAQWWEILAVMVGLTLLAFEIFVIPGFGVAGIAGIVLLFGGLVMTFVGNTPGLPGVWQLPQVREGLRTGIFTVIGGVAVTALLGSLIRRYLPRVPIFNRLILAAPAGKVAVAPGIDPNDVWPFSGTVGVATTNLKPGGSAEFPYADDRRKTAVVSDSGYVEAGTKVAVIEVRGTRVVVRAIGRSA
jgi:membrane-bound serine protease (ClpP class)